MLAALLGAGLATAAGADALPGLRPYLRDVRQDRAVVAWTTLGEAGRGVVEYSSDGENWRRMESVARKLDGEMTGLPWDCFLHTAELRGLAADTRYSYRVLIDGEPVADWTGAAAAVFRTAGAEAFRFLVLGDSGDGGAVQAGIARRMEAERPDFVLHTGDVAYQDGTFQQLSDYYFGVYAAMLGNVPFFTTPGNHDYYFRDGAAYRALLGRSPGEAARHASFNWGPAHIAVLDSTAFLSAAAEGDDGLERWLDADLRAAHGRWLIVIFHHTPYPIGHHREDEEALWVRQTVAPILERHGVHMVLNGHEHIYMRTKALRGSQPVAAGWGTVYVTTGGGGGVLHPVPGEKEAVVEVSRSVAHFLRVAVEGTELRVHAIGHDGEVLDEFAISGSARLAAEGVTDAAGGGRGVAPGGLVRLSGRDLAWGPVPGGVKVTMDGVPLRLVSVARDRVLAQVPQDAAGVAAVELSGPNGAVQGTVRVEAVAPVLLLAEPEEAGAALARHRDERPVTEREPAAPGEWINVFLTGVGLLDPQEAEILAEVEGRSVAVGACRPDPELAGVFRLEIQVRHGARGSLELRISRGGKTSNAVLVPVR